MAEFDQGSVSKNGAYMYPPLSYLLAPVSLESMHGGDPVLIRDLQMFTLSQSKRTSPSEPSSAPFSDSAKLLPEAASNSLAA